MIELKKPKAKIIEKAVSLAKEYEAQYKGCGQCTFLAIIDALRWGGLALISERTEESYFSAVCGFTGGTSMVIDGTCGAVNSSILTIGLALGINRGNQNEARVRSVCATIKNTILEKFYGEYKSISCRDIMNIYFGKIWNLTDDDASDDFLKVSHGCAIMQTVGWTTEIILDEFGKGNAIARRQGKTQD